MKAAPSWESCVAQLGDQRRRGTRKNRKDCIEALANRNSAGARCNDRRAGTRLSMDCIGWLCDAIFVNSAGGA